MKKTIAALLVSVMTICTLPSVPALAQENYITRGEAVEMLLKAADDYNPDVSEEDIIKGYGRGELNKENPVTKAEALIMLNRAFGGFPELKGNNLRIALPKEDFSDIPSWAEGELEPVFDAGIVSGTAQGVFSPGEKVTEEEMERFINRVFAIYGSNERDSFYASINKEELDNLEISEGETSAGTINEIYNNTQDQIEEIIKEAVSSQAQPDTAQGKIKVLYNNYMNMEARNEAGFTPIADDIEAVDNIKSLSELDDIMLMDGAYSALSFVAGFDLTIDSMDSGKYQTVFMPASASLAQQVYEGEAEIQKDAYIKYIEALLVLCGENEEEAQRDAENMFEFEKQLSDASLSLAEQYDLEKTYNVYTLDQLQDIFSSVDLKAEFERAGFKDSEEILVSDEGNMLKAAQLINDGDIDDVKNYIKVSLISSCAGFLSEDFRNAGITYNQEAYGIEGSVPLEEAAISAVDSYLSDYIGQIYAQKYCSDEIVSDVTEMVYDIIDVYEERISNLTWMSDATKEKALLKLTNLRINVGAPDYENAEFPLDGVELRSVEEGGSYFENAMEMLKAYQSYNAALSYEAVDREQWITTPQTVNAFYMPSFNSINLPVAFLQAPVYDKNASYEENLGGLGFVIGHEITHAFDSSGAQYDEKGNAADWWTAEDKAAFNGLCDDVVEFFDGQEIAPEIYNDGELTLGENIADLGALACVVELGGKTPNFDFKKMFENYALLWLSTSTREVLQTMAYVDEHSADKVRVDRVLQSCDKFYEVYSIGPDDGMYVPPQERVGIW